MALNPIIMRQEKPVFLNVGMSAFDLIDISMYLVIAQADAQYASNAA